MEPLEVFDLIKKGEDSYTELKQDVTNSSSLAAEIIAFLNYKGGRILIGVNDEGEVVGIADGENHRIHGLISNVLNDCIRPYADNIDVDNVIVNDKVVVVLTIPAGTSKPYQDQHGVFWIRSGESKRRVTSREEIQRLFQQSKRFFADEEIIPNTSINDLNMDRFKKYFKLEYQQSLDDLLQKEQLSLEQLLNNLALAKSSSLNLACLLMFGVDPQRYRPVFSVKAVSFIGNDPTGNQFRDKEEITGTLQDLYRKSITFLTRNLRKIQSKKSFNSQAQLEVSRTTLEELVVNMLVHRDFFISAPWRVFIFDNRIELISPGSLPNNLTIENIKFGITNIRNPLIHRFAIRVLPYSGIGTGIRRALNETPDIKFESNPELSLFSAIIPRSD